MIVLNVPHHIREAASLALGRMGRHAYTAEDVAAYRAWITWRRLHGATDEAVRGAVELADDAAKQLGIP